MHRSLSFALLALLACDLKDSTPPVSETPTKASPAPQKAEPAAPATAPPVVGDGEFALMESESIGQVKLGTPAKDVEAKLGAPRNRGEVEEEGATGDFLQPWDYLDRGLLITMSAATKDGPLSVSAIDLKDKDAVATARGIKIGSTRAEVEKAYGEYIDPEASQEETIVAGSVYGGMLFELRNGKVSHIFLGAMAE